jgi:hypothetical protein
MPALRHRWVRVGLAVLLALGLIATITIDVAVAQQRRAHDRKVAAARAELRAELAYLRAVRSIAADVFATMQPYNQVLDSLASDPFRGDIFEARDAFAAPIAGTKLTAIIAKLATLRPPVPLRTAATDLHDSLASLQQDVTGIRRQASVQAGQKLFDAIDTTFSTTLLGHEVDWSLALTAAFDRQHQTPPAAPVGGQTAAPTMVTWVFRADRTCDRAFDVSEAALLRFSKRTETPADFGTIGRALSGFTASLRKVALPASDAAALRREILARLAIVDATARSLGAFSRALSHGDSSGLRSAFGKLQSSGHAVTPLVNAFRSRHVMSCTYLLADLVQFNDKPAKRPGSVAT